MLAMKAEISPRGCRAAILILSCLLPGPVWAVPQSRPTATRPPSAQPLSASISQQVNEAMAIIDSGENLFQAYRILRSVFPEDLRGKAPHLRLLHAWALARSSYELGRNDEARQGAEALLALAEESGDEVPEIYGRYYRASAILEDPLYLDPAPNAIADLQIVADRAGKAGLPAMEFLALLALGKLQEGPAGREALERALESAHRQVSSTYVFKARAEMARQLARDDPDAGYRLLEKALAEHEGGHEPWALYGWQPRLDVTWAARPRPEAIDHSLGLIERIEAGRRAQREGTGKMGFFSAWVPAYRRVIGLLLEGEGAGSRPDLELAFELSEKMRARVLLERLDRSAAGGSVCPGVAGALKARRETRAAIGDRQRRLLTAAKEDLPRLRLEIESLMLDEEALHRDGLCGTDPPEERAFVELQDLEKALDPDEALLVFQVGSWKDPFRAFDGGSWVFLVTREGTQVVPLPDEVTLRVQRDAFLGSVPGRGGQELPAAIALYDGLLREVEARLAADIRRWIVVPHGPLEGLPLAALRAGAEDPPVAERYQITYVPSATLWWKWSLGTETPARSQVLALADPSQGASWGRLWPSRPDAVLARLPAARREARDLVESLSGPGMVLVDDDATEHAFKREAREGVSVVLFAAHAVIDEQFPSRSAIILAPGDEIEDGLLQPPEIAELPLAGSVVILSACQSATGRSVEGEGLLSLARSFFQAGARAVVGNLWPARDDDAAEMFGAVYRHLGRGLPLARALQEAQRESLRQGKPAEAWAGVVVLGDGDVRLDVDSQQAQARRDRLWWLLVPVLGAILWLGRRVARGSAASTD